MTDADRELASRWVFSPHQVLNCAKDIAALRQAAVAKREEEIYTTIWNEIENEILEARNWADLNKRMSELRNKYVAKLQTGGGA